MIIPCVAAASVVVLPDNTEIGEPLLSITLTDDSVGDGLAHVDFPASSPYVLSCGGTKLSVDNNGKIISEVVWHESNNSATGGGVSEVFPKPAYQNNAMIPTSVNSGFKGRGVPDIAAVADRRPKTPALEGCSMTTRATTALRTKRDDAEQNNPLHRSRRVNSCRVGRVNIIAALPKADSMYQQILGVLSKGLVG